MNVRLMARGGYGALMVLLCAWMLQSFLLSVLVACVTAIASWPVYRKFRERLPQRLRSSAAHLHIGHNVFVLARAFAFVRFSRIHELAGACRRRRARTPSLPFWRSSPRGNVARDRWQASLRIPSHSAVVQRSDSARF